MSKGKRKLGSSDDVGKTSGSILANLKTKMCTLLGIDAAILSMIVEKYAMRLHKDVSSKAVQTEKSNANKDLRDTEITFGVFLKFLRILDTVLDIMYVKFTVEIGTRDGKKHSVFERVDFKKGEPLRVNKEIKNGNSSSNKQGNRSDQDRLPDDKERGSG